MRKHRAILANLLKEKGYSHAKLASLLGYNSASAVGMMLRGQRLMGREELTKMCELAGITILELASMSDDLILTKRPESAEAAVILDAMSAAELMAIMPLLRSYKKSHS